MNFQKIFTFLAVLCLAFVSSGGVSDAKAEEYLAKIYSLEGACDVVRQNGASEQGREGAELFIGDKISVSRSSRVGLEFKDGTFVRLGSLATMVLRPEGDNTLISLNNGEAHFLSRDPIRHPTVQTPTVTAAIRGTEFVVIASAADSVIAVVEGQVSASNQAGTLLLNSGEAARVKRNEAPVKDQTISLKGAVQWTAFVPFVGSWEDYAKSRAPNDPLALTLKGIENGETPTIPLSNDDELIAGAAKLAAAGKLREAENSLGRANSQEALLLKGRLAISNGDFATGKAAMTGLLASGKFGCDARATLALAALSTGDVDVAEKTLVDRNCSSHGSFSVIATTSLLCQAKRDLECALTAAELLPTDSDYAKVRKAELLFGMGRISEARDLLSTASDSSYKDSIEGFLLLAAFDRSGAEARFERAALRSPGSALPKLGLGLVAINRNDLATGRRLLLEAAQLEPQNAAVRSYLGKLFSESGDEKLARREYGEAIRLDSNDPTPWLYRSFTNLSENRPVAALYDLNESMAKNDNRAIFRSSQLLDQDTAVRSANLSRVYRELGFFELGRIEAVKALTSDYRNYSAHRLLSESQDTIFLADAALSERSTADILAPLSLNLFDSVGGSVSFGDYTGLFDRDETKVALGGGYNSLDEIYTPNILVAGKKENYGYAAAFESGINDGSAKGNSGQDYRISGALHYQPDFETRVGVRSLLQYSRTDDLNAFEQEDRFKRYQVALEGAHDFGPQTTLLMRTGVERSYDRAKTFGGSDTILSTQIFGGQSDTVTDDIVFDQKRKSFLTSTQTEAQLIEEAGPVSAIFGGAVRTENRDQSENSFVVDDARGELVGNNVNLPSRGFNDLQSYTSYLYNTFHLTPSIHLTGGLAYERVERELRAVPAFIDGTDSTEKLSPKVALLVTPLEGLTLRAAYLEGVAKSSFEDQSSLEPTQLAGINQRFNDLPGTETRSFGSGVDFSASPDSHVGAEWIRRYLAEPFDLAAKEFTVNFDADSTSSNVILQDSGDNHINQDLVRGYWYQVLSENLAGALDYRYTKQRLTDPEIFSRTADHTVSSTLRYFMTSGYFLMGRGSWRYQERGGDVVTEGGSGAGWLFDAGVGYRMPNRRGTVALEVKNLFGQDLALEQLEGIEPFVSSDTTVALTARFVF